MKELNLDYTRKGKLTPQLKKLLLFAGILMMGFGLATAVIVVYKGFSIGILIGAIANTFLGITFILQSAEHKILFPKKYIRITTEAIQFKLGGWYNEQNITWDSVTKVSDEGKSVHLYTGDNIIKINMLHFPSSDEKRIKSTLKAIAEAKSLPE